MNRNKCFFIFPVGLDADVLKKNRALSEDFTKLYLELQNEGMFEPSYTHNILRLIEVIVMCAFGCALLQWRSNLAKFIGSVLIGLSQGRSGWLQHESGHNSISGNPKIDKVFHALSFGKYISHPRCRLSCNYQQISATFDILKF